MSSSIERVLSLEPNKMVGNYRYSLDAFIGSGAFSKVYAGFDPIGEMVAIKVIERRGLDKLLFEQLRNEILIMQNLKHPNIVRLFDVIETQNNIYVITEYCPDGDLESQLTKKRFFSEKEAISIMKDIFNGLKELILRQILHRDIKPANIFRNGTTYKLGDFGFATVYTGNISGVSMGTPIYMSPQALTEGKFSLKNDIWAVGIMYYQLLFGHIPWQANSKEELLWKIMNVPIHFHNSIPISEFSKKFILHCLKYNEGERYTWEEIFKHPLFYDEDEKRHKKKSFERENISSQLDKENKEAERKNEEIIENNAENNVLNAIQSNSQNKIIPDNLPDLIKLVNYLEQTRVYTQESQKKLKFEAILFKKVCYFLVKFELWLCLNINMEHEARQTEELLDKLLKIWESLAKNEDFKEYMETNDPRFYVILERNSLSQIQLENQECNLAQEYLSQFIRQLNFYIINFYDNLDKSGELTSMIDHLRGLIDFHDVLGKKKRNGWVNKEEADWQATDVHSRYVILRKKIHDNNI